MRKAIAIDFDGCLCESAWPDIGRPRMEVIRAALAEQGRGTALILWTCRSGELLEAAVSWCRSYGLEFDTVNENLPERLAHYDADCRKVSADEYWDDHAVLMPGGAEPPDTPLSLEALYEMDGEPVWVHLLGWALVRSGAEIDLIQFVFSDGRNVSAKRCYASGFVPYLRRPREVPA